MKNDSQITLNSLFSEENNKVKSQFAKLEPGKNVSSLKEKVLTQTRDNWPIVFSSIGEKIADILNIPIPDILVMAWKKYSILLKYLDKEKYPPGETFLVQLVEHTVKSEHKPYIEIMLNEEPLGRIEFEIIISLAFKGLILKIQDGKIMEIATGSCKGNGTIKCENQVILDLPTDSFSFPGTIKLGEGIPIAG